MRLNRFLAMTVLVLAEALALGQKDQKKITHEEEVVRTAYAKLSFGAQVGVLWNAVAQRDGWPGLGDGLALTKAMDDQIQFDLSGFKVGKVRELGTAPWTTLVEGPSDVIFVSQQNETFGIGSPPLSRKYVAIYANAAWKIQPAAERTEQERPSIFEKRDPNAAEILAVMHKPDGGGVWDRYASYSVVAILRGRTISYRATFLFSKGTPGGEEVLALDYALAMGVSPFVNTPMYPSALVDTALREIPFVQAWIVANQIGGCKRFKEPEVCCDPATGRCGLASEDVQRSMLLPIDPDTRGLINTRTQPQ